MGPEELIARNGQNHHNYASHSATPPIPKLLAALTSTGRQKLEKGQESSETLLSMSTQIIISSFVFSFLSHIKQYKAVVVDSEE